MYILHVQLLNYILFLYKHLNNLLVIAEDGIFISRNLKAIKLLLQQEKHYDFS